jgi:hypothetical protein
MSDERVGEGFTFHLYRRCETLEAERDAALARAEAAERRYARLRRYAARWLTSLHAANDVIDELRPRETKEYTIEF